MNDKPERMLQILVLLSEVPRAGYVVESCEILVERMG